MEVHDTFAPGDHQAYMKFALSLACKSPPRATNFCVGAVLVNESTNAIISTGYTLELPGNTHAEQCCLSKASKEPRQSSEQSTSSRIVLYTTMEPCNQRASQNVSCVDHILQASAEDSKLRIHKVYVGIREPETFVGPNIGKARLEAVGIEYIHVTGLEEDILAVATSGHQ